MRVVYLTDMLRTMAWVTKQSRERRSKLVDLIKIAKVSVCRKPHILFNDEVHFPVEISFSREITDRELEAIAALAQVIDETEERT